MRILFLGSPAEVSAPLKTLLEQGPERGLDVVGVVTPPPRPVGRKLLIKDPPLATFAKEQGLNLLQTPNINSEEGLSWVQSLGVDVAITAAFGQILKEGFLRSPKRAVINIHPSLLPSYRGATPVQSALLDELVTTGVTILFTVKALDAGHIIRQINTPIHWDEKAPDLMQRLFALSGDLLVESLELLKDPHFSGIPQDPEKISHCKKIEKKDGWIDWKLSHNKILAQFRAYFGWPRSSTLWGGKRITIVEMRSGNEVQKEVSLDHAPPGHFIYHFPTKEILVKTGTEILSLRTLQPEGSQPMPVQAFWNGIKSKNIAHQFECPPSEHGLT